MCVSASLLLGLNNILLHGGDHILFSIHLSMDIWVVSSWGRGMENDCLIDMGFSFGSDKNLLKLDTGDICIRR